MPFYSKDRVKETTTATGTGSLILDGPVNGYISFISVYPIATDQFYYCIQHTSANEWEVGYGYVSVVLGLNRLFRLTVLAGTNGTSPVNFSSGIKEAFVTYPADRSVIVDNSTNTIIPNNKTAILPAAYGGTGLSSPGTAGNVLTSTGSGWSSAAVPIAGLTKIGNATDNNANSAKVINLATDGTYVLTFENIRDGLDYPVYLRFASGADLSGTVYNSGYAYTYTFHPTNASPTTGQFDTGSNIPLTAGNSVEATSSPGLCGFLYVTKSSTLGVSVTGQLNWLTTTAAVYRSITIYGTRTSIVNYQSIAVSMFNIPQGNIGIYKYV